MTATATRERPAFTARARNGPERRVVSRDMTATPAAEGSTTVGFRGHAVVYNEWTQIVDPWWGDEWMESIAPGACTESISTDDIRMLFNHDPNLVLARRRGLPADTLRLSEDPMGLLCEADMDARQSYVRDLAVALERGDVTGMSFAFNVTDEEWDMRPDGMWMRTIRGLQLWDVSPVTYPAYAETDAQLRARPRRAFAGAQVSKREGKRNSASDAAVLQSSIDRLNEIAEDLQPLLEAEQAEGDNDDDVATLEGVITMANDIAADLTELLGAEEAEPDESMSARAAWTNQAARNRGLAALLGMPRPKG